VDLAANAESLGARVIRTGSIPELNDALKEAKASERTTVIYVPADRYEGVPDYDARWDVPVAEVSGMQTVKDAREGYEKSKQTERRYL
jgi:3D-(3,5/4)-trihydroxycyclohexane-1,2-dione acylhydrolase (decyclizing)